MTYLILALVLLAVAVAAPFFGHDSRDLDDHRNEFPWDRLPR
jgi:hypothetical protein